MADEKDVKPIEEEEQETQEISDEELDQASGGARTFQR